MRLDLYLTEQGLAPTRSRAKLLIDGGSAHHFRLRRRMQRFAHRSAFYPHGRFYGLYFSGLQRRYPRYFTALEIAWRSIRFYLQRIFGQHFANRNEVKAVIEARGGKVTGSVTSKTNYLINNDTTSNSSKNKKAKELNIPIISEEDFLKMLG